MTRSESVGWASADGDDIASAVLNALNHGDRRVRAKVIDHAARSSDPDALVVAVGDPHDAVRRNAAMDALVRGGARSVPALVRALGDRDLEVVMFAASLLGRTRTREAVPHLVRLLDYEDVNIVQAAVESLGHLRAAVAVDPLVALLGRDPWLRYAAIHALGEIGDPRAVEPLGAVLGEEDAWDLALQALAKIRSQRCIELLAAALEDRVGAPDFEVPLRALGGALCRQPAPAALWELPGWVRLAGDRVGALAARLGEVLDHASDGDQELAAAAASVVRLLRLDPLYGALVRTGRRQGLRPVIRFHAIGIGPAVADAVAGALADPHPAVREFCCACAGALRLGGLVAPLVERLGDEHVEVRVGAVRALAEIGAPASVPPLAEKLLDPEPSVRAAVQDALGCFDPTLASEALLAYPRREPAVVLAMLRLMRASPHPDQLSFLLDCLRGDDPEMRRLAIEAIAEQPGLDVVELLAPALEDADEEVRLTTIHVLGRRRTARACVALLEHLARTPARAPLLVQTLIEMEGPSVVSRLIAIYEEHPEPAYLPILEALAQLREPVAEPLLIALLGDPDPEVRRSAARAVAQYDSIVAIRHLIAAATDPAWQVRATVAEALAAIPHPDAKLELERLCLDEHTFVATTARHTLEVDESL